MASHEQAASPSNALVSMSAAGVRRDGHWLVHDLDLEIQPGAIVTLIGPNGSGKSTTAKLATGVMRPTSGTIVRRPDLRIGYVPQKVNIDWTMPLTVRRLMTLTGGFTSDQIGEALKSVGADHLSDASIQTLSGGEFQRVLLARAMIRKPGLLVLDEPVQGVDFAGEVAIYDLIRRIRDETSCGILMISHDLHVVMAETDTVICLNNHICCRGTPASVVKSPEYLQLFGARAASTLALYQHDHDHTHLPDGTVRQADGTISPSDHPRHAHHHQARDPGDA